MEKPKQLPLANVVHNDQSYGRIIATGKGNVVYKPIESEAGRRMLSAKGSCFASQEAYLVREAKAAKERIQERGGKKEAERRAKQLAKLRSKETSIEVPSNLIESLQGS